MKFIIFIIIYLLNINISYADEAFKEYTLKDWEIIEKNIYINSSFIYFSQNPFPTCYALTANILIDLFECKKDSSKCKQRSSYLDTALSGEVKSEEQKRSLTNGGNTLMILNEIKKSKIITNYKSCNYNHITYKMNTKLEMNNSIDLLKETINNYFKYVLTSPYLSQYYKKLFFKQIFNDYKINNKDAELLLKKEISSDNLYEYILRYNCQKKEIHLINPYKINTLINKGKEKTYKKIDELIMQKIPVAITFCLDQKTVTLKEENDCKDRHIVVISGITKVKNFETGEEKKLLNIINTWGQEWQNKTNSSIEYDNFKEYMFENLIWLTD